MERNDDRISDAESISMEREMFAELRQAMLLSHVTDSNLSFDAINFSPPDVDGQACSREFLENFSGSTIKPGFSPFLFSSPLEIEYFSSPGGGLSSLAIPSVTDRPLVNDLMNKDIKTDKIDSEKPNPCAPRHVTSHIVPRHDAPAHLRHVPAEVIRHIENCATTSVTKSGTVSVSEESLYTAESGNPCIREPLSENFRRIDTLNLAREQYEKNTPNKYKLEPLPAR